MGAIALGQKHAVDPMDSVDCKKGRQFGSLGDHALSILL
jgi:hypothetical protein